MKITTKDLKDEDWEKNFYWEGPNMVIETKKGTYTYKNARVTSINMGLDYDNGLGSTEEHILCGNDKEFEKFVKGE